jgi:hypothetical protein
MHSHAERGNEASFFPLPQAMHSNLAHLTRPQQTQSAVKHTGRKVLKSFAATVHAILNIVSI